MTIQADIATWAAARPPWQQAVLRKLARGETFDQSEIDAIASDLAAGTQPSGTPLQTEDVPGAQVAGATVSLRSVRDTVNINALVNAKPLTFAPDGLTVVYGDNGSGKSGYARLIKDAVGARHREPVHADVFADTGDQPQGAQIEFTSAGTSKTSVWPGSVDRALGAVAFYDEACGDAYIGGDSELTYRPSALGLMDGLIAVCDAVGVALEEMLRGNEATRPPLPAVAPETGSARFLASLSGETTTQAVDAACVIADDASDQLGILIQEEARLRATDPSRERDRLERVAKKLDGVAAHLEALAQALSDERVAQAAAARQTAIELRAAATLASAGAFEKEPVHGVGSDTWRALWEAARGFSETEAYHGAHFPVAGHDSRCVLCQQELGNEAKGRLQRFEAFVQDTTATRARAAEQSAGQLADAIRAVETIPATIAADLVELEATDKTIAMAASGWLQAATSRRSAALAHVAGGETQVAELQPSPHVSLVARAEELRARATTIDATQFRATLADAIAKKNELEGRIALAQHRADIETEIERLGARVKLDAAKRLTDTTGITRKATELTEAHVTSMIRDRFTRESDRLRLERIELKKTGGQKGRLRHRPSLLGARSPMPVQQVLSEGEQTALGLAGYFTEAHFDESKSALVLDDPVTSLDHIRRGRVAQRLAELGQERQVIVFTHDVAFVGDLRRAADEAQVNFAERGIERRGDKQPGITTEQHPWKAKDVPRRFNELAEQLARIKRQRATWDQETYEKECSDWAGKLSETWERLINLEVVYQVVDQGTSEVRPKMFKVLARITEQDDREFQQSYGRISGWARRHDKSPSTNYVAPEPSELEQELAFVKAWFERVRTYRSK